MPIWNNNKIIKEIFNIFQLFHFTILLKQNFTLYIIVSIIVIALSFLTAIIIIIMAYRLKTKKRNILWPIKILKFYLPIFCFGFYGQIFLLFTTIFYCRKKESSTSPYLKCRNGHWFYKIKPVAGIAMFLHFLIAFITNTLYYKPIFMKCKSDLLKKSESLPDILLLFTKMIVITIFILDKGVESEHWAILSFLVIVTGTNAYFTIIHKNRQNPILLLLNNYLCLVLFSGFFILLIGKILKFLKFDGAIFLFFTCDILIIIYMAFFKTHSTDYLSKNYKNINDPKELLQYITQFYDIIQNKNNSRNFDMDLKSIISSIEEHCLDKDCPLKKYMKNLYNGLECDYFLLQFCDKLFQHGISKFRGNNFLKNHYCIFLIIDMNNKKKALTILNSINQNEIFSFSVKYNIYTCGRIIENYVSPFINKNNSLFEHRVDIQNFKLYIEKVTILFCEFFSLLLESKLQDINNIDKINKIGHQIIKLNKKTINIFDHLMITKTNHIEILKLYSEYAEFILKDEEKIRKCQELKNILYNNAINDIHNKDFSNFNLDLIKENNNSLYLIISSEKKSLGTILDCSINLSNILGYQKRELIGNNINIIIPKIFWKKHNLLIIKKAEENRLNFLEKLYKNEIYFPDYIEKDIYCISKSNFLIPLNIKIYLINSEDNELVYLVEITKKIENNNDLLKKNDNAEKYCILTDNNFFIQSFSINCLNFLNINYQSINHNFNIINYIKQFKDDYLSSLNILDTTKLSHISNTEIFLNKLDNKVPEKGRKMKKNISNEQKQKIRSELFNKKYIKKCRITWNSSANNIIDNINTSSILYSSNIKKKLENNFENEKELYMESKKIILDNELVGYYFFFSKIYNYENKCNLNYKKIKLMDSNENLKIKNTKKYQCSIKNIITNQKQNKMSKFLVSLRKKTKRKSLEKMIRRVSIEDNEQINSENQDSETFNKYSSNPELVEVNEQEDIIIDDDFIPKSPINFFFDIKNNSFNCSKNSNNSKILNDTLKTEAMDIINIFKKLNNKNQAENSSSSFDSSEGGLESSESEEFSESKMISDSISDSNSIKEKKTKKNKENITNTKSKNSVEEINNNKDNINNDVVQQSVKIQNNSNYYKVNLNHIHFMIYDFNKESIVVEKDKKIITSKIENIMKNLKNQNSIEIGKDENYPYISFKNIQDLSKKELNRKEKAKVKVNEKENNNLNKEDKINREDKFAKEKLNEIINNKRDEKSIKKLKIIALLFYIFSLLCGIFSVIYDINFYDNINENYNLVHNIAEIRFLEGISVYYARELVLLNFQLPEIEGGVYTNIPAKNRAKYFLLIKEKLSDIYKKNQITMSKIFSIKNTISNSSEDIFYSGISDFISPNDEFSNDIHTFLIKYNADLYYLSDSFSENNKDYIFSFNFIYNNFNKYRIALDNLIDAFGNEYEKAKKRNIYYISFLIILLLIFVIIYIIITIYFMLSNKISSTYLEIIYNINSDVLKLSMIDSLNLSKKIRESKYKNNSQDEDKNNSLENKQSFVVTKKANNINMNVSNKLTQKNNKISFNNNIFYIIIFGILLLINYFFFIYNCIHLFNIVKKADSNFNFSSYFQNFQNELIDMFNVYREYIYDNETKILNMNSLDYLKKHEQDIYDIMREHLQNTDIFIGNIIANNPYIIPEITKPFCSYFETDYFNSIDECIIKFNDIMNYDFTYISNYFLEEIKTAKNLAIYKFENENIKGNLNNLNRINLIEEFINENKIKKAEFRLNIFNNETLHSSLNLFFINSILPHLIDNRYIFFSFLGIDGEESFFIKWIIVYIVILTLCFFGYLNLIIHILNNHINKSKTIISVFPINLLKAQDNNKNIYDFFVDL